MLIVMAGLPGSGKSALAGEVARELGCALLSVDPIEAAMWRAGVDRSQPTGLAAYVVAEDLAREQLLIGNDALIDAVNDAEAARAQWVALGRALGECVAFVEVFCGDDEEHQRRLSDRRRAIIGFPEPSWASAIARRESFRLWADERLHVDSLRPMSENVAAVLEYVARLRRAGGEPDQGSNGTI